MNRVLGSLFRRFVLIASLAMVVVSAPLQASPLDDARNAGHAEELTNGYVRARPDAPANVQRLIESVNKRRRAAYERIARENGISVEQVATESYVKRYGSP